METSAPEFANRSSRYRGRIAPSPTGYLHLGHGRTFWMAYTRARRTDGVLILRNEDLDPERSSAEFAQGILEDLLWLGLRWEEGPDRGGQHAPYEQSKRLSLYRQAFDFLRKTGVIYPCFCSRKDIRNATTAPHGGNEEPVYPGTCRPPQSVVEQCQTHHTASFPPNRVRHKNPCWRFRIRDGETITFTDGRCGTQSFVAGQDFGDFVIWRHDELPSYQLATVVDDAEMEITEVVRGEDLLLSTARQLLLYRALKLPPPDFYHCPLVLGQDGTRLAKRSQASSLRDLRARGVQPQTILESWAPWTT